MTEIEIIKLLVILIGVLGLVLICLDRWNDALRAENKELWAELERFRSNRRKPAASQMKVTQTAVEHESSCFSCLRWPECNGVDADTCLVRRVHDGK